MKTVTAAQLAEWKALADAATPGPWKLTPGSGGRSLIQGGIEGLNAHDTSPGKSHCIAEMYQPFGAYSPSRNEGSDSAFIVAARTSVPALIQALTEARRERDDILEHYGYVREQLATLRESSRLAGEQKEKIQAITSALLSATATEERQG